MNFTSLSPSAPELAPFIDYYYVQRYLDTDISLRYQCFPHLNHTLSLFEQAEFNFDEAGSHVSYNSSAKPLHLLTAIRSAPLWVHHTGPLRKIGVVFKPLGLCAFTKKTLNALVPNFVAAADPFDRPLEELSIEAFSITAPAELIHCLDCFFLKVLEPVPQPLLESVFLAVTELESPKPLQLIAEEHGISRRHLLRLFQQHLACSPEVYRQVARFRQVLHMATKPEQKLTLTQLAYASHHADQSHWNKQCRKWTGYNPKKLLHVGRSLGQQGTFWRLDFDDKNG
ncbi:helix-turn-helix domain-containing protein [uncultured Pontibacter sp.]|uniref:helix-turn-helix domain-containing protein n=1 Tax=uncultured Pontibacter sp. TaxID=453356 RepID=UPI00262989AF|nr:helix-turn-helix domain-containing protein [uncultured Pontibacter sp.]